MADRLRSCAGLVTLVALLLAVCAARADTVSVDIDGLKGALKDNVEKFLTIAAQRKETLPASLIRRYNARAPGQIKSALQPFGYYQPRVTARLTHDGDAWRAHYRIKHGPATRITKLDLRATGPGADAVPIRNAVAASTLKTGDRLEHSAYKQTKGALLQAAYDAGYLDAKYDQAVIRVHPEAARAEVALVLATGPRYHFGSITIEQHVLAPAFVKRYVHFKPGDPFNTDQLTDLQLALTDTDYFNQVEISADHDKAYTPKGKAGPGVTRNQLFFRRLSGAPAPSGPRIPVVIHATPRKPRKYTVSAGYGTDTGPRVGLGAEFRRLNRYGHTVSTRLRISQIEQALTARYAIPIDNVETDQLAFDAKLGREIVGDAVSESGKLSLSSEDGWRFGRRRFYVNLERETFDFGGPGRTSDLLYPGATLTFQVADDSLRTRRGVSLTGDVHGGSDALISSTSFIEGTLNAKTVLPLAKKARLLLRGELGAIETDDFGALPPTQRFFAGGARSVRGYAYQSISPVNADNDDIGGKYLAVGSVEAEYLFYGNFGAAAFFDAGDAAMTPGGLDPKRGVGIGFRWLSPVGTVRLDFAHPLDDSDTKVRIHFSLGPDL